MHVGTAVLGCPRSEAPLQAAPRMSQPAGSYQGTASAVPQIAR